MYEESIVQYKIQNGSNKKSKNKVNNLPHYTLNTCSTCMYVYDLHFYTFVDRVVWCTRLNVTNC